MQTVEEILDEHCVPSIRDCIRVRDFLLALTEAKELRVEILPGKRVNGKQSYARRFDSNQLNHLLAGRSLTEVAREFASISNGDATPRPNETPALQLQPVRSVVLRGPDKPVLVLGKAKPALTTATYDTVKALLKAGSAGLSKEELDEKSGHPEARKYLKARAESDADWAEVIEFPRKPWGRYRIRTQAPH
jgi:hypothetical protein